MRRLPLTGTKTPLPQRGGIQSSSTDSLIIHAGHLFKSGGTWVPEGWRVLKEVLVRRHSLTQKKQIRDRVAQYLSVRYPTGPGTGISLQPIDRWLPRHARLRLRQRGLL